MKMDVAWRLSMELISQTGELFSPIAELFSPIAVLFLEKRQFFWLKKAEKRFFSADYKSVFSQHALYQIVIKGLKFGRICGLLGKIFKFASIWPRQLPEI